MDWFYSGMLSLAESHSVSLVAVTWTSVIYEHPFIPKPYLHLGSTELV